MGSEEREEDSTGVREEKDRKDLFQGSKCLLKHLSLYSRVRLNKRLFVADKRPFQETTTNQNPELWSPVPVDTSAQQLLHLRLKEHYRRGIKDCEMVTIKLCPLCVTEKLHP